MPGLARAESLGFPTVNIPLSENISGVYAGHVKSGANTHLAAIFADPRRKILEAYILDFSENLYGATIEISLHEKIRDSKMFTDDAELQRAITSDVARVREYFKEV